MFSSSKFQGLSGFKFWRRLQLFHATDFQSLMYPNFIFCRVLGIFPYKINASTFETSKTSNILRIFFLGAFCIYDMLLFHKVIVTKKVNYADVILALQIISYYTFGGFITIVTYILSGPRMRVLQAVMKISSTLSPESCRMLSRLIHVKDILGTFFLIMLLSMYYFKVPEVLLWYYVLGIYIELLVFQMDMLYMNCVCVLKTCFKAINDNLVDLQDIAMNDTACGPRLICDAQESRSFLMRLKTLKKQHLIISDTVQMLNVVFNLQLLATVAFTFTCVTFQIYFHLMRWEGGLFFILSDEIRDICFSMYVGYMVLKLILIVWACETVKNRAVAIGTTVHDVLNCTSDIQIKKELRLFSLQILHFARNTFTMKGLTIDATLLAAMTGSVTTYILILAQFTIMSHSCDSKTTTISK